MQIHRPVHGKSSSQRNGITQGRQEAVAKPVGSYGDPSPGQNLTLNCTPGV
jgi:hypothetical protein